MSAIITAADLARHRIGLVLGVRGGSKPAARMTAACLVDTSLMLVPAYDFDADDWLTARMTVLGGVEGEIVHRSCSASRH